MTYFDPPSPSSKERTAPPPGTPTPTLPEREKKPAKKMETPVLVAIISAVVTLTASVLGSPLLLSLVDKADSPTSTPAAESVISQNTLPPASFSGGEISKPTFTPTQSTTDILELTSTPLQGNPTSAPSLFESTFTPTGRSPQKPNPPTPAAPLSFQCLAVDLWFPYPTTLNPKNSNGCWDLAEWGFSTDHDRLLLVLNPLHDQQRGIYTPISGNVDVRFSIQMDEFRMRTNKGGFLNFGIVQNDPFSIYKGGYLSYQQPSPGTASPVRILISGSNQATQQISALKAGFQQDILLAIHDDRMLVYLNGEQTGDPVSLPPGERAFWIGYVLPSKGALEVVITNFTIQTH
jgi:hypothetical protein